MYRTGELDFRVHGVSLARLICVVKQIKTRAVIEGKRATVSKDKYNEMSRNRKHEQNISQQINQHQK